MSVVALIGTPLRHSSNLFYGITLRDGGPPPHPTPSYCWLQECKLQSVCKLDTTNYSHTLYRHAQKKIQNFEERHLCLFIITTDIHFAACTLATNFPPPPPPPISRSGRKSKGPGINCMRMR